MFVTKSPPFLLNVAGLDRAFANPKFLFMARNPYAVIEGIWRRRWKRPHFDERELLDAAARRAGTLRLRYAGAAMIPGPDTGAPDRRESGRGRLPPAVEKPAGVRPLGRVDTGPLKAMLGRLTENVWRREDECKDNDFPCFHHTRRIVFRFIDGNRDARRFRSYPGWTIWRRTLLPAMEQATAGHGFFEPVYPKAMLARLAAGHGIDRHVDGAGSNLHTHKIHIPLRTEPAAVLTIAGVDYRLREGRAYEVNNLAPHGAFNGGTRDRIHFIFEVFDAAAAFRPTGTSNSG